MNPKFRAWTEEGKVMYYDVYPFKDDTLLLSYDEIAFDEVPSSDFILMQSTGLKDRCGEEIFEGDIIKFSIDDGFDYGNDEIGIVRYQLGTFRVDVFQLSYLLEGGEVKIIGNVYETEDLQDLLKD